MEWMGFTGIEMNLIELNWNEMKWNESRLIDLNELNWSE